MGIPSLPKTWNANDILRASDLNGCFTTIRDHYNSNALELGGSQTVTGVKTFSAAPVFSVAPSFSAGLTITAGKITTAASVAGTAGLNLPHGTAPTAPADGDVWTTTSGLLARINGSSLTFPSGSGTNGKVTRWTAAGIIADASLADDGTYVSHAAQPRCFLDPTTATTCAAAATVSAEYPDADTIDVGAMHDPVTNNTRITVPASAGGLYLISALVTFGAASTNGTITVNLRKNGTTNLITGVDPGVNGNSSEAVTLPITVMAVLSAADYVEVRVANGGSQTINFRAPIAVVRLW